MCTGSQRLAKKLFEVSRFETAEMASSQPMQDRNTVMPRVDQVHISRKEYRAVKGKGEESSLSIQVVISTL